MTNVEAIYYLEQLKNSYTPFLREEEAAIDKAIEELYGKDINAPRWIPVTERLPEQGERYLVIRFDEVTKTPFVDILWYDAYALWWNRLYKGNYNVTHWMPLPEQPKEGERE